MKYVTLKYFKKIHGNFEIVHEIFHAKKFMKFYITMFDTAAQPLESAMLYIVSI